MDVDSPQAHVSQDTGSGAPLQSHAHGTGPRPLLAGDNDKEDDDDDAEMPLSSCVPMCGPDAVNLENGVLTEYEREEILEQTEVYYLGAQAAGTKVTASRGGPLNCGFDDATGRYAYRVGDHIGYRYRLAEALGRGAFGDCYRAYDYKRQMWVALKIIKNEPRYHRQGKIEINVLELLRAHDVDGSHSLVHMVDYLMFRNHLVITFELLGTNLYSALRAGGFAGVAQPVTRDIARDVLKCLELLRSLDVVHADLKPENILLRPDYAKPAALGGSGGETAVSPAGTSVAKVIDFGSSCFRHGRIHTYIQSRYYRAPEITLGMGYGPSADMWSLGCILVELDGGHPLFPAKCEADLVLQHAELLGRPSAHIRGRARRALEFFDENGKPLATTDRKGRTRTPGTRQLRDVLQSTDPQFAAFVERCLTWDPAERMTTTEALRHQWVTGSAEAQPRISKAKGLLATMRAVAGRAISG